MVTNGIFAPAWVERDKYGEITNRSRYPSFVSTILLIENAVRDFGITKWRLSKLLGIPHGHNIYQYGKDFRFGPRYLSRFVHLYHLHLKGLLDPLTFNGEKYWAEYNPRMSQPNPSHNGKKE